MTEQTQPTDAELIAFATEEQFLLFCDPDEFTDIARAVLAKWGTPAGAGEVVAWVDERAISWLENSRAHSATITTTLGKAKSSERPMPLHGAQQPTQAQAGAVPLPKFLALKFHARRDKKATVTLLFPDHEAADAWVRGIRQKGADHGQS